MGWDSQAVVKRSDHAEAEWAFVIEDFGDAVFPGEVFCEVFLSQSLLLHAEADGFDGVWKIDGMMLLLVALDQQRPEFEFLFLFGTGIGIHKRLHLGQGGTVFDFGFKNFWFHNFRWLWHRFCHTARGFRKNGFCEFRKVA